MTDPKFDFAALKTLHRTDAVLPGGGMTPVADPTPMQDRGSVAANLRDAGQCTGGSSEIMHCKAGIIPLDTVVEQINKLKTQNGGKLPDFISVGTPTGQGGEFFTILDTRKVLALHEAVKDSTQNYPVFLVNGGVNGLDAAFDKDKRTGALMLETAAFQSAPVGNIATVINGAVKGIEKEISRSRT